MRLFWHSRWFRPKSSRTMICNYSAYSRWDTPAQTDMGQLYSPAAPHFFDSKSMIQEKLCIQWWAVCSATIRRDISAPQISKTPAFRNMRQTLYGLTDSTCYQAQRRSAYILQDCTLKRWVSIPLRSQPSSSFIISTAIWRGCKLFSKIFMTSFSLMLSS